MSCYGVDELLPRWSASLPMMLASGLEHATLAPRGLAVAEYSTDVYLTAAKTTGEQLPTATYWPERIQRSGGDAAQRLAAIGIKVREQFDCVEIASALKEVDSLLRIDSGIRSSVQSLVLSIHMIESQGPDYDSSFSDPEIPFSIFVSVPQIGAASRTVRLMEGIVHEAMHLQLSAFERESPIVFEGEDESWFSPWKKSPRKLGGILHGMYVFHTLAFVYSALIDGGALDAVDADFAGGRIENIIDELRLLQGVEESPALTAAGATLASAILAQPLIQP